MAIQLVDAVGGNPSGTVLDQGNGCIQQFSDGTWLMAQKINNDETVEFLTSPDRITWTSVGSHLFSLGVDDVGGQGGTWAMVLDASDNLHFAYATSARTVLYRLFTWGGSSFTMGSPETAIVAPAAATEAPHVPAIEVLDSGVVVVAAVSVYSPTSAGNTSSFRVRARHTGGTWGTEQNIASGALTSDALAVSCNLARDLAAASGGTQKVVLSACGGINTNHQIRVLTVTLATGAIALTAQVNNASLSRVPYGNKTYLKVHSQSAGRWRLVLYYSSTVGYGNGSLTVAEINAAGSVVFTSMKGGIFGVGIVGTNLLVGRATSAWMPDRLILATLDYTANQLYFTAAIVSGTSVTFHEQSVIDLATLGISAFAYITGGSGKRNITGSEHLFGYVNAVTDNNYAIFFAVPTHTPTGVVPALGATVTTDIPNIQAAPTNAGNLGIHACEWQFAQDIGFTTGLRSVVSTTSYVTAGSTISMLVPVASQLAQGVWYLRTRAIDIFGQAGPWQATRTFTVAHAPSSTSTIPSGGVTYEYGAGTVAFEWGFSDPSPVDLQTAYQIQVERNSDGAVIADSGKVTAGGFAPNNSYGSPTIGRGSLAISAPNKDIMLRWRVRVWDSDDVVGAYSGYQLFQLADAPVVAITAPGDGATVDNPQPLFTWSFTAGGGRVQSQYRVLITDMDTFTTVHDSGWRAGTALSYQPPQAYLVNAGNYSVLVEAQDNIGLIGSDLVLFDAAWTPPAVPSGIAISASSFDSLGYITVGWNAAVIDADFHAWRVYRREEDTDEVVLAYETTNPLTDTFDDWYVLSGVPYEYNVVQVANRFGALIESVVTWQSPVTGTSSHYWLLHPDDNTKNIKVFHVITDDFTEEYESETTLLIGRGRKVDFGSRWGYTGTLVCQIRGYDGLTARQIKKNIEAIKAELREVFLRNPFGDLWQVSIGDLQVSRLSGVGTNEYCTVTVPYQEVS